MSRIKIFLFGVIPIILGLSNLLLITIVSALYTNRIINNLICITFVLAWGGVGSAISKYKDNKIQNTLLIHIISILIIILSYVFKSSDILQLFYFPEYQLLNNIVNYDTEYIFIIPLIIKILVFLIGSNINSKNHVTIAIKKLNKLSV